jgi:alpha-glucuronidase
VLSTTRLRLVCAALLSLSATAAQAEDGYDLWLRYRPVEAHLRAAYAPRATAVVQTAHSPTLDAAAKELRRGLAGMSVPLPPLRSAMEQ